MNKVKKLLMVVTAGLLVANCSATYNMKSENIAEEWFKAYLEKSETIISFSSIDSPKSLKTIVSPS